MSPTASIEQLARDEGLSAPRRYVVDWERAEATIGTRLPADYKEYVYWFGPGDFDEYLTSKFRDGPPTESVARFRAVG
ncbi:SMI1/KNR4 family protein [Streptomyces antibioticus]|uniref:SMI1/KNR4 family protein n=1 Tax=Streptomyces antibioticus TaxID=1890 RepID=UPI00225B60D5|nr:SMI1/KNR4 family protein [Streptomyces antibioticus]MCX4743786.1 SMI1/KNR4 family protein [Streptomyces antibioticus]